LTKIKVKRLKDHLLTRHQYPEELAGFQTAKLSNPIRLD